ncbi:hypothetical protein D7V64_08365 [Acinetobacter cumulans]|uniref:Uncharacterized protein n=1 Tax=Acinetobacter cumulans TaxID=2136182 RepID=A0A3A8G1M9_9GAMM|nr:hypothetical protein [Acinetobacter cumulans]RKG52997.1 hypothetical protein D7V64_08365 [Acinetobacter cumulans]
MDGSLESSINIEEILSLFDSIQEILRYHLHDKNFISSINGNDLEQLRQFTNVEIQKYKKIIEENALLFKDNDFFNHVYGVLEVLNNHFIGSGGNINLFTAIRNFKESFQAIELAVISLRSTNNIYRNSLAPKIEEVKEKIKDFEALQLALEQRATDEIYLNLYKKYDKEYLRNNLLFLGTVLVAMFFGIYTTLEIVNLSQFSDYIAERNFWITFITVKVLLITGAVTFGTLFLRRSAHAKKLKEQVYQIHVEINAFPIYVRSLDQVDKNQLIKELAMRYFGRELDQNQNDKTGDLIKDQLVAGTELIRASSEMIKVKNIANK